MYKVAIIGTAGRGEDSVKMTPTIFQGMVTKVREVLSEKGLKTEDVMLVSGGAPWADHVAVRLYLQGDHGGLTLHLPAELEEKGFRQNRNYSDPGRTLNYYHQQFTAKIGSSSIDELNQAREKGAVLTQHNSFSMRNAWVAADADFLIAFTWANGSLPKPGGTRQTWDRTHRPKVHIPLESLTK